MINTSCHRDGIKGCAVKRRRHSVRAISRPAAKTRCQYFFTDMLQSHGTARSALTGCSWNCSPLEEERCSWCSPSTCMAALIYHWSIETLLKSRGLSLSALPGQRAGGQRLTAASPAEQLQALCIRMHFCTWGHLWHCCSGQTAAMDTGKQTCSMWAHACSETFDCKSSRPQP